MERVELKTVAPEFALADWEGQNVCLADYYGKKHIILVLNRGFV